MPPTSASFPACPILCKACHNIFKGSFKLCVPFSGKYQRGRRDSNPENKHDIPEFHQASAESLYQAVAQNCFFCSSILKRIPDKITNDTSLAFTSYYLWTDDLNDRDTRGPYGEEEVPIKNFLRLSFAFGSGPQTKIQDIVIDYILYLTEGEQIFLLRC